MEHKTITLAYTPFTGLGKFNGFRGNAWLKNRIQIFKQFVIPSWRAQTSQDFTHWISWRPEEKNNKYVKELGEYLKSINYKFIFTFHGILMYDDKYEDAVARERLVNAVHYTMPELTDLVGDSDFVLMVTSPSDDLYDKHVVGTLQWMFAHGDWDAIGFKNGYIINYQTKEVAEYNPSTNPPFATIKFPRKEFLGQAPMDHINYTAIKHDVGKYKKGTPLPSHEYYKDVFGDKYCIIDERGFTVGVHGENISTNWNIPYKGEAVSRDVLKDFGIYDVPPLNIQVPLRKKVYFSLPHKVQRKIRYWLTEFKMPKISLPRFFRTTKTHQEYWRNRKVDWQKNYLSTWNHPHRQVLRKFLEQLHWMSLMEVGCGPGANLVQIVKNLKGRQVQLGGCDISPSAIATAEASFKGGHFFVCPNDDIMMSDKSADVIVGDMTYIYTSPSDIRKCVREIKRVTRSWVVLCEFNSTSWLKRFWVKIQSGYNTYDWKKLLLEEGFYDVVLYQLRNEDWPGSQGTYQEGLRYIIIAKSPKDVI